jgi:hypothetical protein
VSPSRKIPVIMRARPAERHADADLTAARTERSYALGTTVVQLHGVGPGHDRREEMSVPRLETLRLA